MIYPSEPFEIIAKTFSGLEEVLKSELEVIGVSDCQVINRGVRCQGGLRELYRANYLCRTALRFLVPVADFEVSSEKDLYDKIYRMNWDTFLTEDKTLAIEAITSYSPLTHSKYIALKAKDAIVDRFRDKTGSRPDVDTLNPDLRINIRVFRKQCTVSLDSSGGSLHKRGYRVAAGPAPVNEVLAAGMILLTGWKGDTDFLDPMCGSGTLPVEAAMIGMNIPSGSFAQGFGFQKWPGYNKKLFEEMKEEAAANIRPLQISITGSDMSGRIIHAARQNVQKAGLEKAVRLRVGYFSDLKPPGTNGIIVTNPPYGERISPEDINKLYSEIGNTLKAKYAGFEAWLLSADLNALKQVGLHATQKIRLFNGQLECRFMKFDLYQGSKKSNIQE